MKVLITGGAGFIGSTIADRLISRRDNVSIIDNFTTGRIENVPEKAHLFDCSITNDKIISIFDDVKPDVVVHAAASYKDPDDWHTDILTNSLGTSNIITGCKYSDCKRIIYFQTSLCYGHPQTSPITLKHPITPTNSYAISKTAAERYIALSGLDFVSFRLANCFGPRNLSGPIPTFYQRLTNNQPCFVVNTRRDFVFINDLVDIVVKAIDGVGDKYYHISTGKDFSIKELYECVTEALDINIKAEERERGEDDVASILLENHRTTKDFNSTPNTPLKEGIQKAVDWYKINEIKETYTHLRLK